MYYTYLIEFIWLIGVDFIHWIWIIIHVCFILFFDVFDLFYSFIISFTIIVTLKMGNSMIRGTFNQLTFKLDFSQIQFVSAYCFRSHE